MQLNKHMSESWAIGQFQLVSCPGEQIYHAR